MMIEIRIAITLPTFLFFSQLVVGNSSIAHCTKNAIETNMFFPDI